MDRPLALIVDDEPDIRELLTMTLQRMDIDADTAEDVTSAKKKLKKRRFSLCLTDMRLPDANGLQLVEWMQDETPQVPVAVITAHGNVESAVQALKLGAFDFVSKPVDLKMLRKLVGTALKLDREDTGGDVKQLLGDSPTIERVRALIGKVARSQAPVLIGGESGTGKELVARLIHSSGPRNDKPFVPVNCGAIPTELMESEFFGHKRGSFTGAVGDKNGLFRDAEGGTLFLDELAELPLHMQVKLLRVIQEKSVRPVGESHETPVDVRILSATHRDLEELVAQSKFREDLYYRINVIELPVPSLRERGDDLLELADHILERLSLEMECHKPALSKDAVRQLRGYSFPGNVRELENVLERAMTLCEGDEIGADDLSLRSTTAGVSATTETTSASEGSLPDQLEEVERDAIVKALEQTKHNKTAAAKLLGMSFRALRYRIKKLGIE